MPTTDRQNTLILGASGKLGRMVLSRWAEVGPDIGAAVPVYRKVSMGRGVIWSPGEPVPEISNVRGVVALWGDTSPNVAPRSHAELALAAQQFGRSLGARVVVHCSSAAIYGAGTAGFSEQSKPDPCSAYGRAKALMEKALFAGSDSGELWPRAVVLRIGNVAGADSLFGSLARNMSGSRRVILHQYPDGSGPARSYVSPDDLTLAIKRIVQTPGLNGVLNLGAREATCMADVARAAGAKVDWQTAPREALKTVRLDTTRLNDWMPGLEPASDPEVLVASARRSGVWP